MKTRALLISLLVCSSGLTVPHSHALWPFSESQASIDKKKEVEESNKKYQDFMRKQREAELAAQKLKQQEEKVRSDAIEYLNTIRDKLHLHPLIEQTNIEGAAFIHSQYIATNGHCSHEQKTRRTRNFSSDRVDFRIQKVLPFKFRLKSEDNSLFFHESIECSKDSFAEAIDSMMMNPVDRLALLHPFSFHAGIFHHSDNGKHGTTLVNSILDGRAYRYITNNDEHPSLQTPSVFISVVGEESKPLDLASGKPEGEEQLLNDKQTQADFLVLMAEQMFDAAFAAYHSDSFGAAAGIDNCNSPYNIRTSYDAKTNNICEYKRKIMKQDYQGSILDMSIDYSRQFDNSYRQFLNSMPYKEGVYAYPFHGQSDFLPAFREHDFKESLHLPESIIQGTPLTLWVNPEQYPGVEITGFTLTDNNGRSIPVITVSDQLDWKYRSIEYYRYDSEMTRTGAIPEGGFIFYPLIRLDWDTEYTAEFSFSTDYTQHFKTHTRFRTSKPKGRLVTLQPDENLGENYPNDRSSPLSYSVLTTSDTYTLYVSPSISETISLADDWQTQCPGWTARKVDGSTFQIKAPAVVSQCSLNLEGSTPHVKKRMQHLLGENWQDKTTSLNFLKANELSHKSYKYSRRLRDIENLPKSKRSIVVNFGTGNGYCQTDGDSKHLSCTPEQSSDNYLFEQ